MTKTTPKLSCEMSVVAEAAGVRNLAERLTCIQRRAAIQKVCGLIQEYTNSLHVQPRAVKSFWT
jgi:hypothetical protein